MKQPDNGNTRKDCQPTTQQEGGLTVIIQRKAKPGMQRQMEKWIDGISRAAVNFQGHLGQNVIRPVDPANPEYVIIFRFDTYEHLMDWHTSDIRQQWVEKVKPISQGKPRIRTVPGMTSWFTLPSSPPRWKTALVIFIILCPLVIGLGALVKLLLAGWPQHFRQIIAVGITVVLMTWLIMPNATRLLKSWLYKGTDIHLPGAKTLD